MAKPRPTDEELYNMPYQDFAVWFLEYNKVIINRYIQRRLIPNRYEPSDIRAYMAERIIDILEKRSAKGKPIANPRTYFGRLIDFWCIEYQRMHGYIFGMPKRPRNALAEEEISKYGFVYFETDEASKESNYNQNPELSYVDANITANHEHFGLMGYQKKGDDPGEVTAAWDSMMNMVLPEDRDILHCLFRMGMSIPEAGKYLGIAVCTAYARRDRAFCTISGYLMSGVDLNQETWKILDETKDIKSSSSDISSLFEEM